jgi:hypothetical protein
MKHSCLASAQEHVKDYSFTRQLVNSLENESVRISSRSLNNQAPLVFSF